MDLQVMLPEVYQIEVSSVCNLECVMCPTRFFPRKDKQAFIDPELIETMIRRGDLASSYFIELQMSGEPFLNPNIDKIVDLIKSTGIAVGLSTNGWFLRQNFDTIRKLDYLTISMDSISRYNEIRVSKSGEHRDIREFIASTAHAIAICKSVDIQCVELPGWESEFETLMNLFGDYPNVTVRSIANSNDPYFNPDVEYKVNQDLCINPWYSVSIQSNGNVVPCCYAHGDEIIYGNVKEQSLHEIWTGDAVNALRESHMTRNYCDMCRKCRYRSPALLYHHNMYHDSIKRERLCQK